MASFSLPLPPTAVGILLYLVFVFGGAIVIDLIWNAVRFARARRNSNSDNEGNCL